MCIRLCYVIKIMCETCLFVCLFVFISKKLSPDGAGSQNENASKQTEKFNLITKLGVKYF